MAVRAIFDGFPQVTVQDQDLEVTVSYWLVDDGFVVKTAAPVTILGTATLAQAKQAIADAIRAHAVADQGKTIPANRLIMFDFITM